MYQDIGKPVFYINVPQYLMTIESSIDVGAPEDISKNLYYTLPVDTDNVTATAGNSYGSCILYNGFQSAFKGKNFIALLGHESEGKDMGFMAVGSGNVQYRLYNNNQGNGLGITGYVNAKTLVYQDEAVEKNGWSMWRVDTESLFSEYYGLGVHGYTAGTYSRNFGSVIFGTYHEMPMYPDLDVTMGWEMDGIKSRRTAGGYELTDYKYLRSPKWGDYEAWEIDETSSLTRNGRRSWTISFSHLTKDEAIPKLGTDNEEINATSNDNITGESLFEGDSFLGQVMEKTLGGTLPFIFQPNSLNHQPDQFAICKFDMNSISFRQNTPNTYKIRFKIEETW